LGAQGPSRGAQAESSKRSKRPREEGTSIALEESESSDAQKVQLLMQKIVTMASKAQELREKRAGEMGGAAYASLDSEEENTIAQLSQLTSAVPARAPACADAYKGLIERVNRLARLSIDLQTHRDGLCRTTELKAAHVKKQRTAMESKVGEAAAGIERALRKEFENIDADLEASVRASSQKRAKLLQETLVSLLAAL